MTEKYLTSPSNVQAGWPSGVKYIVGNEGCERFSYYGMNAILYVYIVMLYSRYTDTSQAEDLATSVVHFFKTGVYAFPMIGAIVADRLLGKYQTILWLSLVYCAGHAVLSLTEGSTTGLHVGLGLIALGSGGIKPCVSAHVGDQFGKSNWHLLDRVYQLFYFMINFGSFFSTLLIPWMKEKYGFSVAFALPGILMLIATWLFWMGRKKFVHVPASPGGKLGLLDAGSATLLFMTIGSLFFTAEQPLWIMLLCSAACFVSGMLLFHRRQEIAQDDGFLAVTLFACNSYLKNLVLNLLPTPVLVAVSRPTGGMMTRGGHTRVRWKEELYTEFSKEAIDGTLAVLRIMSVFFMVSVFWALFDQYGTSWIRQATMMDLTFNLGIMGSFTALPEQISSINPILVMLLIPFLTYGIFPSLEKRGIKVTALGKMSAGMLLASFSFVAVAMIQIKIDTSVKGSVHVLWQLIPYLIITVSEVLVSITGLEFAYSQAPKRMKSTVMGFWLLTVAFGNVLVAFTSRFSHLDLAHFFWLFAILMAIAGLSFAWRAKYYRIQDYVQS